MTYNENAFVSELDHQLEMIRDMLCRKNKAYGDSALNPIRCFSKASDIEQLQVRVDDKISRLMRGSNAGEDVEWDLLGYLLLLRIARERERQARRALETQQLQITNREQ